MTVVDASIVVRLLQSRRGDEPLRERLARHRYVHAPALIDAQVTAALYGLLAAPDPSLRIDSARAEQMVEDFGDLPLARHPTAPYQRRILALRHDFSAYHGCYLVLASALDMPLLTDDPRYARSTGHDTRIELWS